MFEFQVKVTEKDANGNDIRVFRSSRPSGGDPYQYKTHREAWNAMQMCYREVSAEDKRIIEK